nr:unnamed protein product [Callosobruchus analis]
MEPARTFNVYLIWVPNGMKYVLHLLIILLTPQSDLVDFIQQIVDVLDYTIPAVQAWSGLLHLTVASWRGRPLVWANRWKKARFGEAQWVEEQLFFAQPPRESLSRYVNSLKRMLGQSASTLLYRMASHIAFNIMRDGMSCLALVSSFSKYWMSSFTSIGSGSDDFILAPPRLTTSTGDRFHIPPRQLRRQGALIREYRKILHNEQLPIHNYIPAATSTRLKSRCPVIKTAKTLLDENLTIEQRWESSWNRAVPPEVSQFLNTHDKPAGFDLPRRIWKIANRSIWKIANRIRTNHGICRDSLHKWNNIDCGRENQTI